VFPDVAANQSVLMNKENSDVERKGERRPKKRKATGFIFFFGKLFVVIHLRSYFG
jgi:hypothetical protein